MTEVLVSLNIEPLDEGGYLATSDELQGLVAQGRTIAETMEIAQGVARRIIESCVEHGDPLPARVRGALSAGGRAAGSVRIQVPVDLEAAA